MKSRWGGEIHLSIEREIDTYLNWVEFILVWVLFILFFLEGSGDIFSAPAPLFEKV